MHKIKAITSSCSSNKCSNYFKLSEKPRGTGETTQKLDGWYTDPTSRLKEQREEAERTEPEGWDQLQKLLKQTGRAKWSWINGDVKRGEREKFPGCFFPLTLQSCQILPVQNYSGQLTPELGKHGLQSSGSALLSCKANQETDVTANWSETSTGALAGLQIYRDWRYKRGVGASYWWGANTGIRVLASWTSAGWEARPGSRGEASLWWGPSHVTMAHPTGTSCLPLGRAVGSSGVAATGDNAQTRLRRDVP